jgi:hypothetical protein
MKSLIQFGSGISTRSELEGRWSRIQELIADQARKVAIELYTAQEHGGKSMSYFFRR